MLRYRAVRLALLGLALFGFTAPALAGGWAVVTLDALPETPRAGETLHLGFMVRQHGVRPTDAVDPYLTATHVETGAVVRADARKEGPQGHFVVAVSFPQAGTYAWEITPEPFMPTQFGRITILPPAAGTARAPVPAPETQLSPAIPARTAIRGFGTVMLMAALGVALLAQRGRRRSGALRLR